VNRQSDFDFDLFDYKSRNHRIETVMSYYTSDVDREEETNKQTQMEWNGMETDMLVIGIMRGIGF